LWEKLVYKGFGMRKIYNRNYILEVMIKDKKQFRRLPERGTRNVEVKIMQIRDILKSAEEKAYVFGKINRIVQTGGPTVFVISDGTGSFSLKGFIKPGERAFPELNEGDSIKALIKIEEFNGETEGDIVKINKLDNSEKVQFLESLKKIELERAKVIHPKFLVKSPILEKLEKYFIKAATEIRLAIIQDRPIIVRHHNDTDGYSSGFALERAILPLIEEQHGNEKAGWEFFTRAPSTAPFYEIDDSIRDTALSLRNVAKFSNKMPLIIIADNGSSPEDLIAIQQGKVHGSEFIVVDHHYFDEDVISREVLTHINPFLVGEDGSHFSAGMLCSELARFINPNVKNVEQVPALSGFADRIDIGNPEVMKEYLKIAEREGYTKQLLSDIALVIEYVSSKVRFMEVREYIEVLFGEPRDRQKALVNLMSPHIRELDKKGLKIGQENSHLEKIGNVTLQTISIEETFPIGFFPKPGRAVGLVHDALQAEKKVTSLVTAGIMNTAITLRATDEANFSVHELIQFINKKLPEAFINGGGHKNAGSISFIPNKKQRVVELLKEFIKGR
jgi:archaea-specific RecJ-like exonuclease